MLDLHRLAKGHLVSSRALWCTALAAGLLAGSSRADDDRWRRWLPDVGVAVSTDLTLAGGDRLNGYGAYDATRSGFGFDYLAFGLLADYGGHVRIDAAAVVLVEEAFLDHAAIIVDRLPWNVTVSGGFISSRVGFESERAAWDSDFPDQALALGRVFGEYGYAPLGVDLAFEIPAPWTLRPFFAATAAFGYGQRSFYGEDLDSANSEVDELRDFVWILGVENAIEADDVTVSVEFAALLGPNPTGRGNQTDIFSLALSVEYPEDDDAFGVLFETEWFTRRRQVPGGNVSDTSGLVSLVFDFEEDWEAGARFDYLQSVPRSVLELAQDSQYRTTVLFGYEPGDYLSFDLAASFETGGNHDDLGYTVQLNVRAGFMPYVEEEE
ncbi:MAG: hypothetical protein IV100_06745 [Myxococcales bacterium]|nr:hypothetical protein [Myxococcales bacterium]